LLVKSSGSRTPPQPTEPRIEARPRGLKGPWDHGAIPARFAVATTHRISNEQSHPIGLEFGLPFHPGWVLRSIPPLRAAPIRDDEDIPRIGKGLDLHPPLFGHGNLR
jgi:hypothetical protein